MRRYWIILVIAAQAGLLAVMAGQRELILRTGRPIVLRTAPIDPQDPMRGDYVRLQYEITRVPREHCRDGLVAWFAGKGDDWRYRRTLRDRVVYARLRLDGENQAELIELTDRRPAGGIYLRGRVEAVDDKTVRVRYGVEALFTQQGKARAFEQKARGEMAGVPVEADVAVGSSGIAVLRGYHWEPLGITVALERGPVETRARGNPVRRVVGLTVELKNHGSEPVAIVDRPGGRSFRLRHEVLWGLGDYRWVHDGDPVPPARPEDVVVLQPGQSRKIAVDLNSPDWFVRYQPKENGPISPTALGQIDEGFNVQYRIEYVPPTETELAGLPHADLLQAHSLRSRAFSPAGGGVD